MTDTVLEEDPPEWAEPEDLTDQELQVGVPLPAEIAAAWRTWGREVREQWRYLPDDPLPAAPPVVPATVGTVVRSLRWRSGRSQRALAAAAGLSVGAVERLETARSDPRLSTLVTLLGTCDLHLVVVDGEGTQLAVPYDQDGRHDAGDRHLAAHRRQRAGTNRSPTGRGPHPFSPAGR